MRPRCSIPGGHRHHERSCDRSTAARSARWRSSNGSSSGPIRADDQVRPQYARNTVIRTILGCGMPLLALVGCGEGVAPPPEPPRPVTYVTLRTMNPGATIRLTGTAESWKREEIGFEVPGRVMRIVEPGANIVGRTFDEAGNLLTEGTELARLDDERYQIAAQQAQAGADATRTQLEQVIPQQIKEAEANLELQEKELARYQAIRAEDPGATSQQTIDRYDAAVKSATAALAKVEALRATKAAELNTYLAQVDQAHCNIRDCRLFSPFTGQIARVHVIPGGYAYRGIPVVTVQMMDPMKIDIAVSPQTDDRIDFNDIVHVFTASGETLDGYVYLKDTFADPTTRTFLVTLLVRNQRIEQGVPEDLRDKAIPRCSNLWTLQRPEGETSGSFYVDVNAIHQDDEGHYIWKADNLTIDQMSTDFSPVVTVRKVRVTPGDGRFPILQLYVLRELEDSSQLDPQQDVIVGAVTGVVADGGQVILARERWALRPGEVVRVGLPGEKTATGFYVPARTIQSDGRTHYVMVAVPSGDTHQASRVDVRLGETIGQLRRIEASGQGQLQDGAYVIVEGAHYVAQGEVVRPVQEVSATP